MFDISTRQIIHDCLAHEENTDMKRFIAVITLAFAVFSMTQSAFAQNELDALVIESTIWGAAANSENPETILDYLNRYPDGHYADDARQRFDDLKNKQWEAIMNALSSERLSGINRIQAYEQAYDDFQMKFSDSESLLLADQKFEEMIIKNREQRIRDMKSALLSGLVLLFGMCVFGFLFVVVIDRLFQKFAPKTS